MYKTSIKEYAGEIVKLLKREYPDPKIALNFNDNFQLLVAVILSAQCTDERVNMVTPLLFRRFPAAKDYAECDILELEKLIYSTGFYKNKAKNIKEAAQKIVADFGGRVPDMMEELLSLPGVARKTANVVMHAAFGKAEGIVVDTHVCRIAGRLGLVPEKWSKDKNAVKIEQALMFVLPKKEWGGFAHLIILHGRKTCKAKRPNCEGCVLNQICPSAFKV